MAVREIINGNSFDPITYFQNPSQVAQVSSNLSAKIRKFFIGNRVNAIPQLPPDPSDQSVTNFQYGRMLELLAHNVQDASCGFLKTTVLDQSNPGTNPGRIDFANLVNDAQRLAISWWGAPEVIKIQNDSSIKFKVFFNIQATTRQSIVVEAFGNTYWREVPLTTEIQGLIPLRVPSILSTVGTYFIEPAHDTNGNPVPTVTSIEIDMTTLLRQFQHSLAFQIRALPSNASPTIFQVYTRFASASVNGASVVPKVTFSSPEMSRYAFGFQSDWVYLLDPDTGQIYVNSTEDKSSKYLVGLNNLLYRQEMNDSIIDKPPTTFNNLAIDSTVLSEANPDSVSSNPTPLTVSATLGNQKVVLIKFPAFTNSQAVSGSVLRFHTYGNSNINIYATPFDWDSSTATWNNTLDMINSTATLLQQSATYDDRLFAFNTRAARLNTSLEEYTYMIKSTGPNDVIIPGIGDVQEVHGLIGAPMEQFIAF